MKLCITTRIIAARMFKRKPRFKPEPVIISFKRLTPGGPAYPYIKKYRSDDPRLDAYLGTFIR